MSPMPNIHRSKSSSDSRAEPEEDPLRGIFHVPLKIKRKVFFIPNVKMKEDMLKGIFSVYLSMIAIDGTILSTLSSSNGNPITN